MGFESFRVELRGEKVSHREADEVLRKLPYVRPDPDSIPMQGSTYYVVDDGKHLVEIELMDSPVHLSCRFTLCHPRSIDAVFLALVRELMVRLGLQARICEDFLPDHSHPFSLEELTEFSTITSRSIAARRAEWIAAFGDQPMAATTNEVYERIILTLLANPDSC